LFGEGKLVGGYGKGVVDDIRLDFFVVLLDFVFCNISFNTISIEKKF
jgi:hypothetical protein